ncbi:MAG: helix-turn-helix domain-containing protein [Ktedonobacteraceae bacterium]
MPEFNRLRSKAGLTITRMSIEAQISRSTVEKIEKAVPVRAPLASRACKILSKYLEQDIDYEAIGIQTV